MENNFSALIPALALAKMDILLVHNMYSKPAPLVTNPGSQLY